MDPLLRQTIWEHLVEISKPNSNGKSTTIVITTHYIEEARQANRVGMMRYILGLGQMGGYVGGYLYFGQNVG